jgi:hypothetical protein
VPLRVGVAKAYTTRVGSGPYPTEVLGDFAEELRAKGFEYGTTTGRPRRIGWLDMVALNYASTINGFTHINLTKLDVLSGIDELKIGVAYKLPDGTVTTAFPSDIDLLGEVEVGLYYGDLGSIPLGVISFRRQMTRSLKAPGFNTLNLKCDILVSSLCFHMQLVPPTLRWCTRPCPDGRRTSWTCGCGTTSPPRARRGSTYKPFYLSSETVLPIK